MAELDLFKVNQPELFDAPAPKSKYAIRDGYMLVETADCKGIDCELRPVDVATAHAWVRGGDIHGTALYVDHDGKVRYARDD